ncbi:MAG: hypothetical protein QW412_03520 [Candidatus Aenigmatarchaeota archaeon]
MYKAIEYKKAYPRSFVDTVIRENLGEKYYFFYVDTNVLLSVADFYRRRNFLPFLFKECRITLPFYVLSEAQRKLGVEMKSFLKLKTFQEILNRKNTRILTRYPNTILLRETEKMSKIDKILLTSCFYEKGDLLTKDFTLFSYSDKIHCRHSYPKIEEKDCGVKKSKVSRSKGNWNFLKGS